MIATYPVYNKKFVFNDEEKIIDDTLEFITMFRNKKLELGIGSDYKVRVNIGDDRVKDIVVSMLKVKSKEIDDVLEGSSVSNVKLGDISIDIIYDNSKNIMELRKILENDRDNLVSSIARREKLLSNDNYVNKAPSEVVEAERNNLAREKEKLQDILNKLEK